MSLTFGSLFAGIGGMDLGLERAGMTCKWQVEIEPYARRVLAKHWPAVERFDARRGDIRAIVHGQRKHRPILENVDVICGGFPCQDISFAGEGAGLSGKRSGLWKEFHRAIRLVRPRYVLVENVTALRHRGLGVVLRDLAESGYDAEWDCLPASAFGAPHQRDRIWIVAYSDEVRRGRWPREQRQTGRDEPADGGGALAYPDGIGRQDGDRQQGGQPILAGCRSPGPLGDANGDRKQQPQGIFPHQWRWPGDSGWWAAEPNVGRVAYGIPSGVDRLRGLGNAVVPHAAEWLGRRIVAHFLNNQQAIAG